MDTAATETDINDALNSGDAFEQVFSGFPDASDNVSDADASDSFGKRRRLSGKNSARKRAKPSSRKLTMPKKAIPTAPAVDPMSDEEYASDPEPGYPSHWLKSRPRTPLKHGHGKKQDVEAAVISTPAPTYDQSTPNILQIHVNTGRDIAGSTINVDLTPLLKAYSTDMTLAIGPNNEDTLVNDDDSTIAVGSNVRAPSLRIQRLHDARARAEAVRAATTKKKTGFTDLPPEVRIRIYRNTFVTETPVDIHLRCDFKRSSALLRTCKVAHEEGRAVLYGENAFNLERSHSIRGHYYEEEWREIGFKDIRRFLETIGKINISFMRYISFEFSDASKCYSATEETERRFVNDPILWRCLELIGSNAHLDKFALNFNGRRRLSRTDLHFLKVLTSIKSQEVIHVPRFGNTHKTNADFLADIKKLMVLRRDDAEEVDSTRKKAPTVIMDHERNRGGNYFNMYS